VHGQRLLARLGVAVFGLSLIAPSALWQILPARPLALAALPARPLALAASPTGDVSGLADLLVEAEIVPTPSPPPAATPRATDLAAPAGPAMLVTASWYGPGFYGNRLPCWRWLQENGLPIQLQTDTWGVAHKTLPCGTMLRLRHGEREVVVPVVDRGPYIAGRELDLSPRVKAALGCSDLCTVLMQIR